MKGRPIVRSNDSIQSLALRVLTEHGGPERMTTDAYVRLHQRLVEEGATPPQARHALAAASAQLMSASMPQPAYIDVDLCTAHLLAIRHGCGELRFVSLASIQLIVGAAITSPTTTTPTAPHANNIH